MMDGGIFCAVVFVGYFLMQSIGMAKDINRELYSATEDYANCLTQEGQKRLDQHYASNAKDAVRGAIVHCTNERVRIVDNSSQAEPIFGLAEDSAVHALEGY